MNVEGLNALHTCATKLGIIPTISENISSQDRTYSDLIRGRIFVIAFILQLICLLYGKIFLYGHEVHKTVISTFTIMEIVGIILIILSINALNLRHGHRLQKFVKGLQNLEVFIIKTDNTLEANKKCLLQFYIWTMFGIVFGCFSAYVYISNLGWGTYKYFMVREFQNSYINLLMDVITRYPELISLRLKELNRQLINSTLENKKNWFICSSVKNIKTKEEISIKTISEAYTSIAELIEEYNDFIGPICLTFCGHMILNILVPVNMALLYMHNIPVHVEHSFGLPFFMFCVFWVVFPCLIGIKLFTVCDTAEKEAGKVPRICYSLIKGLGDNDYKLKNDLKEYATHASQLKLNFSAAGFFNIHHGLTMPIFGSVFTYIIVLMQFHNL